MTFMNEMDIEEAADFLTANDHNASPWAEILRQFMYEVNSNSDGWPYWRPATAAGALMDCVEAAWNRARYPFLYANKHDSRYVPEPTEADFLKAYKQVAEFCLAHDLDLTTR